MWPIVFSGLLGSRHVVDDVVHVPSASRVDCALRSANSSSPDSPSRRSSSASTSAGVRPNAASAIMVWNHRSATSATMRSRGRRPCRHHDLGRLFADLLQDRVGALGEQPRDVALVGVAAAARRRSRRPGAPACRRPCGASFIGGSFVDRVRVFQDRLDAVPGAVLVALEEARVPAGVAGDAGLAGPSCVDLQQHHVVVAVEADLVHLLDVAATPRPCATGAGASGSSTPPRRARPSCASASRFMKANISTSLLPTSCAITGTRPLRVPLHLVEPVHCGQCSGASAATRWRRRSPALRRTSRSTGSVPGSTGATVDRQRLPGHRLAARASRTRRASRTPCRSAGARGRAGSRCSSICHGWTAPIVMPSSSCSSRRSACSTVSPRFELAARELPVAGVDLAVGPRGEQEAALARRSARRPRRRRASRLARPRRSRVVPPGVVPRELVGDAARARAALERPDQRLLARRRDRARRRRRSRAATAATIARYSSWLNG